MNLVNDKKTSYNTKELNDFKIDFSHEEVMQNLNSDCEDFIKIFSILNLNSLNSTDETELLFKHLTNHPTPIREAVALKLEEIYEDKYFSDFIKNQFLKAIIDINPNVCRAICGIISKSTFLQSELTNELIKKIKGLLAEIKDSDVTLGGFYDDAQKIRKNHAKNKKLFSLYWFLECLSICNIQKNNSEALEIINETIKFNDYTIREKTVKILVKLDNFPKELLQIAKNDQNFYVKNQVCDKINFEIDNRNNLWFQ